jgi:hypothetical protein
LLQTEFTVSILAETEDLAITSLCCNALVMASQVCCCYAGRQFESKYALNVCTLAHFLSRRPTLVLGTSGAQTKLVGFQLETSAIAQHGIYVICDLWSFSLFRCIYLANLLHSLLILAKQNILPKFPTWSFLSYIK